MDPCEAIQVIIDDGAWDGKPPVDIGNGFALSPGDNGVAIYSDYFCGMIAIPWDVVRKLGDYLPNNDSNERRYSVR